jgi:hypothetical protein
MSMLEPVADRIWVADGPEVNFYGFPYPTRMALVQLASGDLWVWSPIRLHLRLAEAVAEIGPVAHLVSPNKLHQLFLAEWRRRFPGARVWGPASTIAKCRNLSFEQPLSDLSPEAWAGDIEQAWFRGSPIMDEIVFFHRMSRTAIFADLVQAFSDEFLRTRWKPWQRVLARHIEGTTLRGGARAPLEWRLSFLDRRSAREARSKVLGWNPQRVVMAHGELQHEGGTTFLKRSLSWLR